MEEKNFRRLTGIKEETFKKMVEIVEIAIRQKKLEEDEKTSCLCRK